MKKLIFLLVAGLLLMSCKENDQDSNKESQEPNKDIAQVSGAYGKDFKSKKVLSAAEMGDIYKNLNSGDTINVTFKGEVKDVCQAKGCWMQIDVGAQEPVMVKFKDYAFFVPKNISNKEVVINGRAFVAEVPVDEQQHFAKDAGKTETEIAAITTPKRTLSFTADGVKIPE